jgi:7,8-dihydroneopterin aldolase/epimerase/oxygenase
MGKVLVEDLEIFAYHGHFEEEQVIGRMFTINAVIDTNFDLAAQNDDLNKTVNYAEVCRIIDEEMKIPAKIIEHVGWRIIQRLKKEIADIEHIELKICKHFTPIPQKVKRVCVVLNG